MRLKSQLQLTSLILQRPALLQLALAKVVAETAFEIERDIKEQMRAPKHGRTYARGAIGRRASKVTRALGLRERVINKGKMDANGFILERRIAIKAYKFHRASAPGEAPAVDKGTLINALRTKAQGTRATITDSARQAALLETGTGGIAARPVFGPAIERARPKFERRCSAVIRSLS